MSKRAAAPRCPDRDAKIDETAMISPHMVMQSAIPINDNIEFLFMFSSL